jgi:hypothetical protein
MLGEWRKFLTVNQDAWGLPPGGEWNALVHNNYHPHYSGMNLLWFRNREKAPRVVTKLHREPALLTREFDNLRRVHAAVPDMVPRPLHLGRFGAFWGLWMAGVPGTRCSFHPSCPPAALRGVADTVTSLHRALLEPAPAAPQRYRRMVCDPLATVARSGDSAVVQAGCTAVAGETSPYWIASLPAVPQHGDFYSGNLLSAGKRWYIVDWESFGMIDLPLYDLLTFCVSLLRSAGEMPDRWPAALTSEIPALIARYCAAFGLSAADARLLLPLALANWFHLQWTDGRTQFSQGLYRGLEHYFENRAQWHAVLAPHF